MGMREPIALKRRRSVAEVVAAIVAVLVLVTVASPASAVASSLSAGLAPALGSPPAVTNIVPGTGPVGGGIEVRIGGNNLEAATAVDFGSTPAEFIVRSSTKIEAIAPPGSEGTVDVRVTTPEGTSEITRADHFSYVPPGPDVVEVRPNEGPVAGGQSVKVYGAHFEGVTKVTVGGTSAAFEVASPELLNVTTPSGATPTEDIRVTTTEGVSPVVPADEYHYQSIGPEISVVSPNSGPATGGNTVIVSGERLYGVTGVEFGSVNALEFTVNSPDSITAVAPAHTTEKVGVKVQTTFGASPPEFCKTNKGKRAQCTAAGPYKYKEPTVTGIAPETGPKSGGTDVTLTGTGFARGATATEILIGKGLATAVDCTSETTCTAVTPPAAKPSTAYVKVTIDTTEKNKSKKNKSVAFHYE
jgi:IPT/TIG domain